MAKVIKTRTVAEYKQELNITVINLFESKSGNHYGCDSDGDLICWVADDLDTSAPMHVLDMQDGDDTWSFLCNVREPKTAYASV